MPNNGSLVTIHRSSSVELDLSLIKTLFFIYVKNAPPQQLKITNLWYKIFNYCLRWTHFFCWLTEEGGILGCWKIWIKNFTFGLLCPNIGEWTSLHCKKTWFIIIANLTLKITLWQYPVDCVNILSHVYRVNSQGVNSSLNAIYIILVYALKCICGSPGSYEEERLLIVGRTQVVFLNKRHDNYLNV